MVFGMATTKITITLPHEQLDSIRKLVDAGKAGSVSAFIKHSVDVALFDAAGWRAMLNDALQQTGGKLTQEERRWADSILNTPAPEAERKKLSHRSPGRNRAA
jgi:Arc/MetJ-type ribon-helix-helix transcriptional regulator